MLKDKVNIQVLKVDRLSLNLFFKMKKFTCIKLQNEHLLLFGLASYRQQIDQSHGENRFSHKITNCIHWNINLKTSFTFC